MMSEQEKDELRRLRVRFKNNYTTFIPQLDFDNLTDAGFPTLKHIAWCESHVGKHVMSRIKELESK